jgi:hypothetical protein
MRVLRAARAIKKSVSGDRDVMSPASSRLRASFSLACVAAASCDAATSSLAVASTAPTAPEPASSPPSAPEALAPDADVAALPPAAALPRAPRAAAATGEGKGVSDPAPSPPNTPAFRAAWISATLSRMPGSNLIACTSCSMNMASSSSLAALASLAPPRHCIAYARTKGCGYCPPSSLSTSAGAARAHGTAVASATSSSSCQSTHSTKRSTAILSSRSRVKRYRHNRSPMVVAAGIAGLRSTASMAMRSTGVGFAVGSTDLRASRRPSLANLASTGCSSPASGSSTVTMRRIHRAAFESSSSSAGPVRPCLTVAACAASAYWLLSYTTGYEKTGRSILRKLHSGCRLAATAAASSGSRTDAPVGPPAAVPPWPADEAAMTASIPLARASASASDALWSVASWLSVSLSSHGMC